jgi:hypothetical protein
MTSSAKRLQRFAADSTTEERAIFGRELIAALDEIGVGPGEVFLVASMVGPTEPQGPAEVDSKHLGGFARDSSTSRSAALTNYPRSGKQRHVVFMAVAATGSAGATSEEIAQRHNIPPASAKPRLTELRQGGWVRKDGTRPSQHGASVDVYVLTEKGVEEYRKREGATA